MLSLVRKHTCQSNRTMHFNASCSQKSFSALIFNYFLHHSLQNCFFFFFFDWQGMLLWFATMFCKMGLRPFAHTKEGNGAFIKRISTRLCYSSPLAAVSLPPHPTSYASNLAFPRLISTSKTVVEMTLQNDYPLSR